MAGVLSVVVVGRGCKVTTATIVSTPYRSVRAYADAIWHAGVTLPIVERRVRRGSIMAPLSVPRYRFCVINLPHHHYPLPRHFMAAVCFFPLEAVFAL